MAAIFLSGFQVVGLPDFRSHSKSGPCATQPLFHHSKSRLVQISDPHCIQILDYFIQILKGTRKPDHLATRQLITFEYQTSIECQLYYLSSSSSSLMLPLLELSHWLPCPGTSSPPMVNTWSFVLF